MTIEGIASGAKAAPRTGSPLGEFLRAKRRAMDPRDVGITPTKGRRKRGLKRAEVAERAGISQSYYVFIERGRDLRPSRGVLDSLGRALLLTADERKQLRALASDHPVTKKVATELISEELEELLESLHPNPAYIIGTGWEVLDANSAARQLFTDWPRLRRKDRNLLWFYCCDPAAQTLFVDWEQEAADQMGLFRESFALGGEPPESVALLERIFEENPQAQDWWEKHELDPKRGRTKRIRLDNGNVVQLRQIILQVRDEPDIHIVAYFADVDGDVDGIEFDN